MPTSAVVLESVSSAIETLLKESSHGNQGREGSKQGGLPVNDYLRSLDGLLGSS